MLTNQFTRATSVLIGTIVGAGIFGLPYAFAKVGFWTGIFYLIILALIYLITNLCYTELILRTKKPMEMSEYARLYLGNWGKGLVSFSLILGIYGALIAYTIGVGRFLHAILGPVLGGTQLFWSLIFWILASLVVFWDIGIVSRLEVFMAIGLIFIALFIFSNSFSYINFDNLATFHREFLFFPYGVVLFALGGASAIPTMRRILTNKAYLLKKAVVLGLVIPVLIYIIFTFTVVGVSGSFTSEQAITGLAQFANGKVLLVGGIFGILAMTTSFLALGHILLEFYRRDYHLPKTFAWASTVCIPMALFLLGLKSFIGAISFSGGVLGGIQGMVLIAAYYKAKKMGDRAPEFSFKLAKPIAWLIYIIFAVGIIYQFIY